MARVHELTKAAEEIDRSVPVAEEIGNTVLTDERHVTRLAGPLFVLLSVLLVPWIVFMAVALPSRQLSSNYDVAWTGFDVLLCAGLAATGYFALRRSQWLPAAAAATAAMLVVDAWFDVVTSPSWPRADRGDRARGIRRGAVGGSVSFPDSPRLKRSAMSGSNCC